MDVIVIFNGLGNQMSQFAFYLRKKSINKETFLMDYCKKKEHNGAELSKIFNINLRQIICNGYMFIIFKILVTKKFKIIFRPLQFVLGLMSCKIIEESYDYKFHPNYLTPSQGITFYFGGWPSEKYFENVKEEVAKIFTLPKPTDLVNNQYINLINNNNSVSIHVRRGDYQVGNNLELFGKVCNKEYFQEAISIIETKVTDPFYFVFSNDCDWVQSNLYMSNAIYVTGNNGNNSWKDMYLMSICKHNIIANSTFSWWGAWLNTSPNKIVISPNRYLNNDIGNVDVYPESWIKIK